MLPGLHKVNGVSELTEGIAAWQIKIQYKKSDKWSTSEILVNQRRAW
jgi:hypothetical protein